MQWVSKNKKWSIHEKLVSTYSGMYVGHRSYVPVLVVEELTGNGYIDFPIMYADKTIAYDNPKKIPEYIKREYKKLALIKLGLYELYCYACNTYTYHTKLETGINSYQCTVCQRIGRNNSKRLSEV
jgi:hypothetical protein